MNIPDITCIPLSALDGDNVVEKSDRTPWYEGTSLLDFLETVPIDQDRNFEDFRYPTTESWIMHSLPSASPFEGDLPQEEEFALANMMPYTYYNFWFLPEYQQEYADKYLLFDDITEKELKVFEETFVKLIKISLWNTKFTFVAPNTRFTSKSSLFPYCSTTIL